MAKKRAEDDGDNNNETTETDKTMTAVDSCGHRQVKTTMACLAGI